MYSVNEWDPLKEVVVGIADHANWPNEDPVFAKESEKTTWKETPVPSGPVPQWIIDETNQDLMVLARTLVERGIRVIRPGFIDYVKHNGMYGYCPRDRLLVYEDTVVDCNMMYPCRNLEILALPHIVGKAKKLLCMPNDPDIILDAANILRLGKDWLFLESPSGTRAAFKWLCEQFPNVNIEICSFYSGVHIDSTIAPLREGLVLLNGSRVSYKNCPRIFSGWEKIYIDDVVPQKFYMYPYASKWIALNVLVIDPKTVIVDAAQEKLIALLKKHFFEVIPLTLRHSRTLGGGFHCVTLDTVREPTK
jgi:scyllo-inosamine-4-phosphate amidinotransferase 1